MNNELTPSDIKKMEDEIEYRVHIVRKKALDDVKEARAQGDLSENFEYYAAKKFKNQNESRIRYLQRMIKTATVISEESADDEAGVNNTVEVKYEDDGSTEKIKLVTTVHCRHLWRLCGAVGLDAGAPHLPWTDGNTLPDAQPAGTLRSHQGFVPRKAQNVNVLYRRW